MIWVEQWILCQNRTIENMESYAASRLQRFFPDNSSSDKGWTSENHYSEGQRIQYAPQMQNRYCQIQLVPGQKGPCPFDREVYPGNREEVVPLSCLLGENSYQQPDLFIPVLLCAVAILTSHRGMDEKQHVFLFFLLSSLSHFSNSPEQLLPAWRPPAPWTCSASVTPRCSLPGGPSLHMLAAGLLLQSPQPTTEMKFRISKEQGKKEKQFKILFTSDVYIFISSLIVGVL